MKIQIGELIFSTNAEAIEHFRAMLYRYPGFDVISESDAHELHWRFERHPAYEQKRGAGILGLSITSAPYGAHGFLIHGIDATTTDLSYRKCIDSPPTVRAKII